MNSSELQSVINDMVIRGKGILAADESTRTITKRFESIHVESTEENRRDYRSMMFHAPDLSNSISGVILFEETLTQKDQDNVSLAEVLAKQNIVPGIKVDKGLVPLHPVGSEKLTQGLDGLAERLATYKEQGARFAKWRAVLNISDTLPTPLAITANAEVLAYYAATCQAQGFVPIVEPEILMDGNHSIDRCEAVTLETLHQVFTALHKHHVLLEYIILKPSMVTAGKECSEQASVEEVAERTVKTLRRTVPAAVPSINFLSGGQSPELATAHLNTMNNIATTLPWHLSFSYGRALQEPCLKAWEGNAANTNAAQKALLKRAELNSAACTGEYNSMMEDKSA